MNIWLAQMAEKSWDKLKKQQFVSEGFVPYGQLFFCVRWYRNEERFSWYGPGVLISP